MPAGSQRTLISIPEIIISLWTEKVKENGEFKPVFDLIRILKLGHDEL
jgi:hypothetical protein